MTMVTPLFLTLALAAAVIVCERFYAATPGGSDAAVNIYAASVYFGAQICLLPLIALNGVAAKFALVDLGQWPFLWAALAFTLLMDFGEFAFHRAQHAFPFLWRMHALHHSDPNMNAMTTSRHFWGDQLIKGVTIWPACALVLRPSVAVLVFYSFVNAYHFFVHSNLRVSFGGFSWLLNHPAYHRRHHSSRPEHFNSNYASLFPVFDVLCGSYHRPEGFPSTGLPKSPRTFFDVVLWPLRSTGS
jgi:sterol desaturase/sphingolipid hydroxylase (fatty acid hydroxylase superfamily)